MTTKESTNICPFLSITPPYLQTIFGTFTPTQFYENHRAFGYAKRIRLCGPFLQPSLKSKPVSVKRIPISCLHVWDKWHSSFQNLYIQCTWSDSDGELHKCLALMYWVSFALNLKKNILFTFFLFSQVTCNELLASPLAFCATHQSCPDVMDFCQDLI